MRHYSFCYVNDAVLGIMHMQAHFDRILYFTRSTTFIPPAHRLRNPQVR